MSASSVLFILLACVFIIISILSKYPIEASAIFPNCNNSLYIGPYCNISNDICSLLTPCKNNGICHVTNNNSLGYNCLCPSNYMGDQCQNENDPRPCKPYTCSNHGTYSPSFLLITSVKSVNSVVGKCNEASNTTFHCECDDGWEGISCESMINSCQNITCLNGGVCKNLFLNYTCQCSNDNYHGRHCEFTSAKLQANKKLSKYIVSITISVIGAVILVAIIIRIRKYCLSVDHVEKQQIRMRGKRQMHKTNRIDIERSTCTNPVSQRLDKLVSAHSASKV